MYVLCLEFDLYTEFNKNYLYRFLSCIYILDFLGLCSLFSIFFYSYPLNRLRDTPYAKGLGLLVLCIVTLINPEESFQTLLNKVLCFYFFKNKLSISTTTVRSVVFRSEIHLLTYYLNKIFFKVLHFVYCLVKITKSVAELSDVHLLLPQIVVSFTRYFLQRGLVEYSLTNIIPGSEESNKKT